MHSALTEGFDRWASSNPDIAYLLGFSAIVLIFYALFPYKIGLDVATSRDIPFKFINVRAQIKKPHRIALSLAAVTTFAFFHFALGAPLLALVAGGMPIAALVAVDYRQMDRDDGSAL